MHNAAFAALGLDWVYVPLPVPPERVADAVRGLVALGFAGCNVTVPHKPAVVPFMDELTPIAAAIGAVNTIVVRPDGSLLGDSTDGAWVLDGFAGAWRGDEQDQESAESAEIPAHDHRHPVTLSPCHRALVIGAGGAARAVVYALAEAGARWRSSIGRWTSAEELCRIIGRALPGRGQPVERNLFPDALPSLAAEADLIVNTTSLGLHGDADPLPWDASIPFRPGQVVYDLIYNVRTPF